MIKLDKILVPTDFSKHSENAVRYGCELASRFDAGLHLLYVLQELSALLPDPEMGVYDTGEYWSETEQIEIANGKLAKIPGEPWTKKLLFAREVRKGNPFLQIVDYAKENDVDLIIVGTHGRTGLSHVFLGSVAELVVRKAPCPVLTVRDQEHEFVMV